MQINSKPVIRPEKSDWTFPLIVQISFKANEIK